MSAKDDFPIFENIPGLTYLDSAATTQTLCVVVDRMKKFQEEECASIHRGIYPLSEHASKLFEEARGTVAHFLGCDSESVVFTSGTTEGINLLAQSILPLLGDRREIVITELEHHSNFLPWQELARKEGLSLKIIRFNVELMDLDPESIVECITENTGVVACSSMSNVLGSLPSYASILRRAKDLGALTVVDAAQRIAHGRMNVRQDDIDFLVFSAHKLYGPTGLGVLYGKTHLLESLAPAKVGGGMVKSASLSSFTCLDLPHKFEAGTPNSSAVIAFSAALEWLMKRDLNHELLAVSAYAFAELEKIPAVSLCSKKEWHNGVISFIVKDVHPHDVAEILARDNVCIRAGHHCAMPLMKALGVSGTCRVSFGVYNTKDDVDKLISGLKKVKEVFHV